MKLASKTQKILIFIDWFLPAYKAGGPIRSIKNLVETLHKEFNFYIITSNKDIGSDDFLNVKNNVWLDKEEIKVIYLSKQNQTSKFYRILIKEISPNVIYLNSLFSLKFTLLPLWIFKKTEIKIILAPRGMLGRESLAIKKTKKRLFLNLSKIIKLHKNILWHASSKIEDQEIKQNFGNNISSSIIPNLAPKSSYINNKTILKEKGSLKIISICRISRIKNIDFLLNVISQIKANISLSLVGPIEDNDYWNECINIISKMPNNCKVNHLRDLDFNEINDEISKHHLFISTSKNENYGHSIVEALSMSCPVLISKNTPWKNLEQYNAGNELSLDKNIFIKYINIFTELSEDELNKYRNGAKIYYNKFINLEINKTKYLKLFSCEN